MGFTRFAGACAGLVMVGSAFAKWGSLGNFAAVNSFFGLRIWATDTLFHIPQLSIVSGLVCLGAAIVATRVAVLTGAVAAGLACVSASKEYMFYSSHPSGHVGTGLLSTVAASTCAALLMLLCAALVSRMPASSSIGSGQAAAPEREPVARPTRVRAVGQKGGRWILAAATFCVLGTTLVVYFRPSSRLSRALRHPDPNVRLATVERIRDSDMLSRVARTHTDEKVRAVAAVRLGEQQLLADVLKRSTETNWAQLRQDPLSLALSPVARALDALASPPLLLDVVESAQSAAVRRAAAQKVTDPATLARVALGNSEPMVRWATAERLADQALLAQMARTDGDSRVRRAAIAGICDRGVLVGIVESDTDPQVQASAIRALAGESTVANLEVYVTREPSSGHANGAWESVENRCLGDRAPAPNAAQDAHVIAVLGRIAETHPELPVRTTATNALAALRRGQGR